MKKIKLFFKKLYQILLRLKYIPSKMRRSFRRRTLNQRIKEVESPGYIEVHEPIKDDFKFINITATIIFLLGIFVGVWGGIKIGYTLDTIIKDFYANLSTTLISISITVFIIDRLYSWREQKIEKEKIIRQLASRSNDFALDAVRLAKDFGWLQDGSLYNAFLYRSNLEFASIENAYLRKVNISFSNLRHTSFSRSYMEKAFLEGADLSNSLLWSVDLKDATLIGVNFKNADLWMADLENACLANACLEGACLGHTNFKGANLEGASFKNANYDQFTVWPDKFKPKLKGAVFVRVKSFGEHLKGIAFFTIGKGTKRKNKSTTDV